MIEMNAKLENIMKNTTDKEKIRLFYEFAKYFLAECDEEMEDKDMENLFSDIATVVNDIENL